MKGMNQRTPEEVAARRVPTLAAAALLLAAAAMMLLTAMSPANAGVAPPSATFTVDRADDRAVPTDITTTCTAAADDCTLREAVVNANNSGSGSVVIEFANNVNTVPLSIAGQNEDSAQTGDLDLRRSMTIDGGEGEDRVVVRATDDNGVRTAFEDRIFEIFTPEGLNPNTDEGTGVTIDSLVVRDGLANGAPGLSPQGTIFGGGIFVDEWATLDLTNSIVRNNTATIAGGGIYLANPIQPKDGVPNPGGEATITDSVITENTAALPGAGAGGGIAALGDSTLELTESTVSDNTSNNLSGGIANAGDATIRRSTISGNTATAEAGGIGSGTTDSAPDEDNELEIFDSTIFDNTARSGAGLGIINTPALVANSTISGNETTGAPSQQNQFNGAGGGAGVQGPSASLFLESVTIAENSAPTSGGGALASNTPNAISAVNTIVADNTQAAGGQCAGAPVESIGFNLEFPGTSCGFENTEDPDLQPLVANGGPTETHALTVDSPAVDQGNTELGDDQRGEPRRIDFASAANAEGGDASDIGAFELQPPSGTPAPCLVRGAIIGSDGDDTFTGTPGDDVICGLGGDDFILGGSGNDTLRGNLGNDTIRGNEGNDIVLGGPGNDTLFGDAGADSLRGGAGDDRLFGGTGGDFLIGNTGNDRLSGQDGPDQLISGGGTNSLFGGNGNDRLNVRNGSPGDFANGGANTDFCAADPSGDTLVSCEQP